MSRRPRAIIIKPSDAHLAEAEGDDDLTAAATESTEEADWTPEQRERTKAFVDGTLVTIADVERAARRARGLGDHERAKTFEMLAKVARGE